MNSIAPTSVNVCDSNGFVVYVNNTGTTPEKDILLNVTIPLGFSYDGYSGIYFQGGDRNDGPTNESGKHLEWNLTEIMTPEMGVVINELLPNPAGTDSGNERIELYNAGTSTVNVKEWYLRDIGNNNIPIASNVLSGNVKMDPRSYLVIRINGSVLNNPGDTVILFNGNGTQEDYVTYGASVEAQSWACVPDGSRHWGWRSSTLGGTNGDLAPGDQIRVEFNLTAGCGTPSGNKVKVDLAYFEGSDSQLSSSIQVNEGFLEVTNSPDIFEAGMGDSVNWTITVENIGPGPAYNVRVNDTISSDLTLLSIDSPGGDMNWSYDAIDPGEVKTIRISANATICEDLRNDVNASWGCSDTPCQKVGANSLVNFVQRYPDLNYTLTPIIVPYCGKTSVFFNVSNSGPGGIFDLELQFSGISADYAVSDVSGAVYHLGNETFSLGGIPSKSWKNFTFDFGVACGDRCSKEAAGNITIYPHYYRGGVQG